MNSLMKKDTTMMSHASFVSKISCMLYLKSKKNVSIQEMDTMFMASFFHDIGKISISSDILNGKTELSPEERKIMQTHVEKSKEILEKVNPTIAEIAYSHHERLDGSGYPKQKKAADLSLEQRILAVADCFGAMSQKRNYKEAIPLNEIFINLEKMSLDQDLVSLLREEFTCSPRMNSLKVFTEKLSLCIPFFFDNNETSDMNPLDNFEERPFFSPKLSNELVHLFKETEDSLEKHIASYYQQKERLNGHISKLEHNGDQYYFNFGLAESVLFEKGIGFLLIPIQLLAKNNHLPSVFESEEFFSLITQVRDDKIIFDEKGEISLVKRIMNLLSGNLNLTFVGNDFPKTPREKPKVFGNLDLFYHTSISKEEEKDISLELSHNTFNKYHKEDTQYDIQAKESLPAKLSTEKEKDEVISSIARNGMIIIKSPFELNYFGLNEISISYLLLWYEYYYMNMIFMRTKAIDSEITDENRELTYNKIIQIRKDYSFFKMHSTFVNYTCNERANKLINLWQEYFDKISLRKKLDDDLKSLDEIISLVNLQLKQSAENQKNKRAKNTAFAVAIVSLTVTLVTLVNGIYTFSNNIANHTSLLVLLLSDLSALFFWLILLILTIKKLKLEK
ncbi:MAG: HD domain-containing phosphohydrolase [Bacilli bacterium]